MRTCLDCVPCFVRQALDAARFVTDDPRVHERVLREVLRAASDMDLSVTPPEMGRRIHRAIREMTGVADPYRGVKEQFNRAALALYPELKERVGQSADPLETAARLAIAGNIIDFGVRSTIAEAEVEATICASLTEPLVGSIDPFRAALAEAGSILYLADNAGEIVCDRLLIEELPPEKVAVAVKGSPIINDATLADAEAAGLIGLVEVIDNGSDAPGTILRLPPPLRAGRRRDRQGTGQLRDPQRGRPGRLLPAQGEVRRHRARPGLPRGQPCPPTSSPMTRNLVGASCV